ncbi:anti-sigma factor domain-containing protein [Clostridium sp. YIM B02505]|uniref:Anti-sigma factor domain-containing protein n=1 Tax=Clostridium yunnanense TaxID=2800325 RepID=A0ABS1ET08_9CLOT|nr:anti-sigma factor domain-containing protein [Clostridium yunnanense]MBK1812428.1 anti-sigma factor domain-containing protein [Clostridium yunnanense]
MDVFSKDKYIFSSRPKIKVVKDIDFYYGKQISLFVKELRLYGVTNKSLISRAPKYETRNYLLNIALFVVENKAVFEDIVSKRDIQISKLSRVTGASRSIIENWRDYLISYIVLFSNPNYIKIREYINIQERTVDESGMSTDVKLNQNDIEYAGISIKNEKKYSDILTSMGEFIRIKNSDLNKKIGQELRGKEKKTFKHYSKIVACLASVIIIASSVAIYMYNQNYTTLVVNLNAKVVFEMNRFNRINEAYSQNANNQNMLDNLKVQHDNVDDGVTKLFKYLNEQKKLSDKDILLVVSGHKLDDDDLQKLEQYIRDNNEQKDNKKIKITINNMGNEKKIDY